MTVQIRQERPSSGESLWDLSGVPWDDLKCGTPPYHFDDYWVRWGGRKWLRKFKSDLVSISEIVGYQIAEVFGLPVQPWAAFYDRHPSDKRPPRSGIGILVEEWPDPGDLPLWQPTGNHRELVCRGMAYAVLDRHEWPRWLTNRTHSELRLVDLEYFGPAVHWPPGKTPLRNYRSGTSYALANAEKCARQNGVLDEFRANLKAVTTLDFDSIVDFSGHPKAATLKRVIVRGLVGRTKEIRRLLD